jgi:SPX domain protein involved in polyphosphate accumulation
MQQDHRLQQQRFAPVPAAVDAKASTATSITSQTGLDASKKDRSGETAKKRVIFDRDLQRYEAKYIIPTWLASRIREYIMPLCEPDPYGSGDPPTYVVTTLQLDSPNLALHYAKLWDFINRFKLRVRTYGDPVGQFPVFLEVKSKYRNMIVKLRSKIPFDRWGKDLFGDEIIKGISFRTRREAENFYEFVRLTKEIGARPIMLIRYNRESYFGKMDSYSRITFDRRLQYQQTYSWDSWGRDGRWRNLDNPMMQTRRHDKEVGFSGVVLEMKALSDVPQWMINLTTEFDLIRVGHCKYSNAMWAESIFRATPWTPEYEIDLLQYL